MCRYYKHLPSQLSGILPFIRIHCNSVTDPNVTGVISYAPAPGNPYMDAGNVQNSINFSTIVTAKTAEATGAQNRGVIQDNSMTGINWCKVPAGLIEMGFMTNQEEDAKLQDSKAVKESAVLKRMYDFEHSDDYQLYLMFVNSGLPDEFKTLMAKMATPEFKQEYAFWSNPNRWKTTDEYQQEVRYKQLAKRADIQFYLKQDPEEIARLEEKVKAKS